MRPVVALVLACLLLAGCPGSSENADQKRLRVMQAEPLLKKAIGAPVAVAGFTEAGVARRGYVQAKLKEEAVKQAPEAAKEGTAETMKALRDNGWNIYFVACQPPLKQGDPEPAKDLVGPFPSEQWWAFSAYGYKVAEGVSYFAALNGNGYLNGQVKIFLNLRAPNSTETSDLFADRPAAVASGESCVETKGLPESLAKTGAAVMVGERATGAPGHR